MATARSFSMILKGIADELISKSRLSLTWKPFMFFSFRSPASFRRCPANLQSLGFCPQTFSVLTGNPGWCRHAQVSLF